MTDVLLIKVVSWVFGGAVLIGCMLAAFSLVWLIVKEGRHRGH